MTNSQNVKETQWTARNYYGLQEAVWKAQEELKAAQYELEDLQVALAEAASDCRVYGISIGDVMNSGWEAAAEEALARP